VSQVINDIVRVVADELYSRMLALEAQLELSDIFISAVFCIFPGKQRRAWMDNT
jgi:hypothetical protein